MRTPIILNFVSFLCLILIATINLSASEGPIKKYDRSSITYLILSTPDKENFDAFKDAYLSVEPSSKFYINQVDNRVLELPSNSGDLENSILNKLNSSNMGNEILAKWFSRDESGSMKPDLFLDRGMYNASDEDVIKALAMKRGLDYVKEYGENLIDKSYVVVIELKKIHKLDKVNQWDQIKALLKGKLKNRSQGRGITITVNAYLYKLNFSESKKDEFYDKCWIYDDDPADVRQTKMEAFKNFKVNFTYIDKAEIVSHKYVYLFRFPLKLIIKPPTFEKLIAKAVVNNYDDQLNAFDKKVEDLQVKVPVYDVKPVSAKVGRKEDLRINQRYFAYEYSVDQDNKMIMNHVGVVRAKKPSDNRHVATGQMTPSKFNQTWGVVEPGMLLVQKPDWGFRVGTGYQFGKVHGFYWHADMLLGRRAKSFPFSELYLSLQAIYNSDQTGGKKWSDADFSFVSLHRPFFITRNINLDPFAGITSFILNTGEVEGGGGIRVNYGIRHNFNAGLYSSYLYFLPEAGETVSKNTGLSYGFNLNVSF